MGGAMRRDARLCLRGRGLRAGWAFVPCGKDVAFNILIRDNFIKKDSRFMKFFGKKLHWKFSYRLFEKLTRKTCRNHKEVFGEAFFKKLRKTPSF
ncbi:hypothetical protein [Komagataeibacter xylinus]|uniref:hypothetical protein n=1 Tax=Komagataeibacter xylinus TaxID=28448 RepID=UPI0012E90BFD|nr:hypothetical protein [Komagataeibacter xylinus]